MCVAVYGFVHVIAGALDPEAGSPRAGVLGSSVLSDRHGSWAVRALNP